jgi:DNA-binding NtrC family response regulator
MKKVLELAAQVATTKLPVLLQGETGTGKGMVARFIHRASTRAEQTFFSVNCGAIAPTLLESELFGHEKGAFTGASTRRIGLLELAHGGTLFLDEVNSAPPELQTRLLHFIQDQRFFRVGGMRPVEVDTRLVVASNKNLTELVTAGRFREDLFYRLNVIHVIVPPLRDRREDIPLLVDHFLVRFKDANQSPIESVSVAAMKALTEYSWPGNVRELENVIERLVVTVQHPNVEVEDLSSEVRVHDPIALRPKRERRRTVADDLYKRLVDHKESFWTTVYPLFMDREITRANVRDVVRRGLEEARGNYKIVARLFNMDPRDYKRFLNFLRKHECQIPFKEYR